MKSGSSLPPEPFGSAVRTGLRYARFNSYLSATLIRTIAFFVFGSAYWALLPLVARTQIVGGPALYGVLLGAIGTAAVGGAFLLRRLREKLGANSLVAAASIGTAVATTLFALARQPATAIVASLAKTQGVGAGRDSAQSRSHDPSAQPTRYDANITRPRSSQ